jgi:hypothetical protein
MFTFNNDCTVLSEHVNINQSSSSALEYIAWLRRLNLFSGGRTSQDDVHVSTSASEPNKDKGCLQFENITINTLKLRRLLYQHAQHPVTLYHNFRK